MGCFFAYMLIFCAANFDVLMRTLEDTTAPTSAPLIIDQEALSDYEYFNSPAVERAMSLEEAEPMKIQTGGIHQMAI